MRDQSRRTIAITAAVGAAALVLALLVTDRTVATVLTTQRLTLVPSYDRFQTVLLVGIGLALGLGALAASTLRAERLLTLGALLVLAWTILADPYSHGLTTGDELIVRVFWQKIVAAAQLVAVVLAGSLIGFGSVSRARLVLVIEAVVFLGVNAVYLLRDGFGRVTTAPAPAWTVAGLLLAGLLVRAVLVVRTGPAVKLATSASPAEAAH
jgi:hypothetical protein